MIGRAQPVTEGHLLDELGAAAPVPEVLRVQLMQLERDGKIARDNNRRFSLKEPEPMAKPEEKGRVCSRCRQTKPPEEMRSNGQCKACGKIYDRERAAKKKAAGVKVAPPPPSAGDRQRPRRRRIISPLLWRISRPGARSSILRSRH